MLAVLALVLGVGLWPAAAASGLDDDDGRTSSDADDSRDDDESDDDSDDRVSDDDSDDDADDDRAEDADDDEDGDDGHQRRRRHRNRNGGGDGDGDPIQGPVSGGNPAGGGGPAVSNATVTITDDAFTPATINLAVGGAVTWSNVSREHTVTAKNDSFDSGVIDAGQKFSHTFGSAGTFDYLCLIHTDMTGTVVVGGGGGTSAPAGRSVSGSSSGTSTPGSSASTGAASASGSAESSGLPALGTASIPSPLTAAAPAPTTADVEVVDYEFAPTNVTVAPGGTVRWTLTGKAPHTVTADGFDSGSLTSGDTYEQTFNDVGTVDYRCEFHPEMTGTVTVAESAVGAGGDGDQGVGAPADDGGGGVSNGDDAQATAATTPGGLADTGFGGVPALLGALAIILAGWAALVTGQRRKPGSRRPV